mgnify:CR=1 FL=1
MSPFKAYLIEEKEGRVESGFTTMEVAQLNPGEVTIRVVCSSINYKDALAATGAGKIIRRFPCVGGIDMAGVVVESADGRFKAGDAVIATSFDKKLIVCQMCTRSRSMTSSLAPTRG